ncbi:pre-mRNA processing RNA-helicase [Nowakowskiella sp. JEL0407]|nr:pre-mRNA processing RNA-helicase [Nowakowskiella sp. JEL0407]
MPREESPHRPSKYHKRDSRDSEYRKSDHREKREDRYSKSTRDSRDSRDERDEERDHRRKERTSKSSSTEYKDRGEVVSEPQRVGNSNSSSNSSLQKPPVVVDPVDEKTRQRREKLEQWRKQKELKQQQQQEVNSPSASINSPMEPTESPRPRQPSPSKDPKPTLQKPLKPSGLIRGIVKVPVPTPLPTLNLFADDDDEPIQPIRKLKLPPLSTTTTTEKDTEMEIVSEPAKSDEMQIEQDSLDAFMVDVTDQVHKINEMDLQRPHTESETFVDSDAEGEKVRINAGDSDSEDVGSDPEDILAAAAKQLAQKKKELAPTNHAVMNYEPFRKDFFIEAPEVSEMSEQQVADLRLELDGIKIRGVNCPKPVVKWTQFGLPSGVYEIIRRVLKYEKPSPIQAQAIPAIMSGRDVIGIAKTGSGKTICFLLPMFRHIKDQRGLDAGEGPIGLIMTPTRELAVQIHKECKQFTKILGLRAVCAYGGSPIKEQIDDLKRGAEIVICTPGRMIDLLCANRGRVTNLKRVTYLVLDEADRMFDLGFEPQVMRIVNNVRPSRQTVLFSATFPRQMEALARKILTKPVEITVGGRAIVADTVTQHVEIRNDESKFMRLLEILGNAFNEDSEAKVLVFVDRHESAEVLLRELARRGYTSAQTLHGGKDQNERDATILDFKTGMTNILIATSVAARGLDVKQLNIVINYECPNHMEDYVHRVGRTGRAGNKGTAYTFISQDEERFSVNIVKALTLSGAQVPPELQVMADEFLKKVNEGREKLGGSGFGGKGLDQLDQKREMVKKIQKREMANELGEEVEEDDDKTESGRKPVSDAAKDIEAMIEGKIVSVGLGIQSDGGASDPNALNAAKEVANRISEKVGGGGSQDILSKINSKFKDGTASIEEIKKMAAQKAAALLGSAMAATGGAGLPVEAGASPFIYNLEINDFPQKARWRVTNKEQIVTITEMTGAAITTRGSYFPPGKIPQGNERKLYLVIEGDSQISIDKAKNEIKRILTEATVASMESDMGGSLGRFKVV